jgi:cytochrome c biogenesis protein CcmG/thiol:disulfide interchange protein DsbE
VPETFVVDGTGRITFKHVGPISEQTLKEQLLPAVRRAQAQTH